MLQKPYVVVKPLWKRANADRGRKFWLYLILIGSCIEEEADKARGQGGTTNVCLFRSNQIFDPDQISLLIKYCIKDDMDKVGNKNRKHPGDA